MAASTTTSAAILTTQYTQEKVYWIAYMRNPAIGTARKDEAFKGDYKMVAAQIETPQGGGTTIALAQSHAAAGVYKRFQLSRKNDFAIARVTGEAMKAAEGEDGTLVQLWTREMDGALHTVRRSAAIHWFRSGTGSRGKLASTPNAATVTLATISDASNFSIGMTIQLANTDGGTLRNSGANAIITTVDRLNGILGFAANLDTYIAAAQSTDYVLREGDLNAVIQGMGAWVPKANVTATLFNNLDRTPDPVRLAGQFMNASGMGLRDMIIESCARIDVEGGDPDTVWMHPRDKAILVKELEGKSYYAKEVSAGIKGSDATIGYDTIEAEFDGFKMRVMSDLNCPRGETFVTQWNTWGFDTLGPFPHIIDYDKNEFLRVYNDDSFEVRTCYRGDVENLAPAYTVHAFNVAA